MKNFTNVLKKAYEAYSSSMYNLYKPYFEAGLNPGLFMY